MVGAIVVGWPMTVPVPEHKREYVYFAIRLALVFWGWIYYIYIYNTVIGTSMPVALARSKHPARQQLPFRIHLVFDHRTVHRTKSVEELSANSVGVFLLKTVVDCSDCSFGPTNSRPRQSQSYNYPCPSVESCARPLKGFDLGGITDGCTSSTKIVI